MADSGTDSAPQTRLTPETSPKLVLQRPESADDSWKIIGEQQAFYDEQDCLYPGYNLASNKLEGRGDHVVIFNYSLHPGYLSRVDGDPPVEGPAPPLGPFSGDDDIFYPVPKDKLINSVEFNQIINPTPLPEQRLGIIDFAQCYDTYDKSLLNSIGEKFGLEKEGRTAFADEYLRRVRALPGYKRFRTGVSLRVPSESSSENRFILFVSFPYLGESYDIALGKGRESARLLGFKRLGVHIPNRRGTRDDIGKILVHQARYIVFDNYTMAIFRSREDGAKDQVPLHRFQERIGAFRAMIHMIANRTNLELSTLEQLQASLCKLEEDIDKIISDATTYEHNQGMEEDLADAQLEREVREERVRQRKQKRVRDLLTALNRLSAALFAAISVAERQIAILRNIHSIFLTSYRTKPKDYERGYPLRQNPFYKNVIPIPILSKHPEQIWPNTLDTIDEVVRDRKSFLEKIKRLVENMDIRRKILSGFLKSDQAKGARETTEAMKSAEDTITKTAQKTADAMMSIESTIARTGKQAAEAREAAKSAVVETRDALVKQAQTLSGFTVVTTVFLPLSFCASYLGMDNLKLFDNKKMSKRDFWLTTGPVTSGIVLLTVIIIFWKRPEGRDFRKYLRRIFGLSPQHPQSVGLGTP
ncbi:hypothetical protein HOY82DRAFT_522130 [Tuber indicum]|nr:hypothetical protein HOY82DRAFT_522130 [Tuber indicum]